MWQIDTNGILVAPNRSYEYRSRAGVIERMGSFILSYLGMVEFTPSVQLYQ